MRNLLFTTHLIRAVFIACLSALALSGCGSQVTDAVDAESESLSAAKKDLCERGQCPCDSPLGSVAHGTKVTVYDVESVGCSQSCSEKSSQVTCNNGKFDRDVTEGVFFTCRAIECSSCSVGSNLVRHGESIEMFSTKEQDCNLSCEDVKQVRTCNNGVLSGDEPFKYSTCQTRVCRCRLPDESGYVSLDGSVDLYSSKTGTCDAKCSTLEKTRTCKSNGTGASRTFFLDQGAQFIHPTCTEATNCRCQLPGGLGYINHMQTTTLDQKATAGCGESCQASDRITVRCENGTLKNTVSNASVDIATTPHKFRCQVEECDLCPKPGGGTAVHGTAIPFYKSGDPSCGVACSDASNMQMRTCKDGKFDGDASFNLDSCAARQPCKCAYPDDPFKFVQVNESQTFFKGRNALCDKACSDMTASRKCVESKVGNTWKYDLDGDATAQFSTCGRALGCSCPLPNGLGSLQSGKTAKLSSAATVACGQSCDSVPSISVTCKDGVLQSVGTSEPVDIATTQYKYTCSVPACPDCTVKGFAGTISNNSEIELFSKEKTACGEIKESFSALYSCENGVLKKNGQPYNADTDPKAPDKLFTSIESDCKGCPLPWGGSVLEGVKINAYKLMNDVGNGCGRGCKVQERTCVNGTLTGEKEYDKPACDNSCSDEGGGAPPRLCLLPWSNSYITPDAQIPVYSRKTVPCGDSCQNYFRLARCEMTTGRFDTPVEYMHQSCTELCPK